MRLLVVGNSGSGKSTLAQALAARHGLAHLDLDTIVWQPGQVAVERPREAVRASLDAFAAMHPRWVVEGCYGELAEAVAPACTMLVFLDPGLEACLAHNRCRPWEPHKYASAAEQDAMLEALQAWVAGYYTRDDAWSHAAHLQLFEHFDGAKLRLTGPVDAARLDDALVQARCTCAGASIPSPGGDG